jgi:ADP-ribosylglycohydrolase
MIDRDLVDVQNSALWAAYGDALGFISELVDEKGLKRRIKASRVTETTSWRLNVGGRFGAEVDLPAGCYSDDTQLRLATCRTIRGDGEFDVEAFAKIELPVWRAYALGAGRGTKAAATNLANQDVNWFSNFFSYKNSSYVRCGGNGAAMRIQPHVWAASERSKPSSFIGDVIRNAICTHGHPRGILGAVFHSLCLAMAFTQGIVPGPKDWRQAVDYFNDVLVLIRNDGDIAAFWVPVWEKRFGQSIEVAFNKVKEECLTDIEVIESNKDERPEEAYQNIVKNLGALKESSRGSGTKTTIIASALSWVFRKEDPYKALETAANLLSSDTDTIATMAGAILGSVVHKTPMGHLLDREYIINEAARLHKISRSEKVDSFRYPDLLKWEPPKTQLETLGIANGHYVLAGLASADKKSEEYKSRSKGDEVWQLLSLNFGQTIMCKRRTNPRILPVNNLPVTLMGDGIEVKRDESDDVQDLKNYQESLFEKKEQPLVGRRVVKRSDRSINELTSEAIKSNFAPEVVGRNLLMLTEEPDGIEKAVAYAAIIAKAKISRLISKRGKI